jgi:hypothetical protein
MGSKHLLGLESPSSELLPKLEFQSSASMRISKTIHLSEVLCQVSPVCLNGNVPNFRIDVVRGKSW